MSDVEDIEKLKNDYQDIFSNDNLESLLRKSHRAYPDIILYDEELWINNIQKQDERANLALSNEEMRILRDHRYPLFINGRPGSGKSTVLQYLFSDHLRNYIDYEKELESPPIYLTYSEELRKTASEIIANILKCNAKNLLHHKSFPEDQINSLVNNCILCWRKYLLGLLPEEKRLKEEKYVQFPEFRQSYEKTHGRDGKYRTISAEMAWYVIRMYIKGMSSEDEYFDTEDFIELPRKIQSVTLETFKTIFEKIWPWYERLCKEQGYWDDQDLVRKLLKLVWEGEISLPEHVVVFCDEAQDFTRNELRLIVRLSLYSQRKLQQDYLKRIPIAFAGDPFQTLNPTGFDWDAISVNLYKIIRNQLDKRRIPQLKFDFEELSFNYRSRSNIVQLCNFIHLIRGIVLGKTHLQPQETWFTEAANLPVYFDVNKPVFNTRAEQQVELVIILPCQEGEEIEFVQKDPILRKFSLKDGQIVRNLFSPMRAKGQEFKRVVLYKFGQICLDEYPELIELMNPDTPIKKLSEDKSLILEYFINRLYVAASRAEQKIIIADTDQGLKKFWQKNFESRNPKEFLGKYSQIWKPTNEINEFPWSDENLVKIRSGKNSDWDDVRDDPTQLAEGFLRQGLRTKSKDPYYLRVAKLNFEMAVDKTNAKRCSAHLFECSGDLIKAAEIWMELDEKKEAKKLLWKAKAYLQLASIKDTSIEQSVAKFMLNKKSFSSVELRELLNNIIHAFEVNEIIGDGVWIDVISVLYKELLKIPEGSLKPFEWKPIWIKARNHFRMGLLKRQEEVHQLKVRATTYPDKLEVLEKIHAESNLITQYYRKHIDIELEDKHLGIVIRALRAIKSSRDLEILVDKYPSEQNYGIVIAYFIESIKQCPEKQIVNIKKSLNQWMDKLLMFIIKNSSWDMAINFVKQHDLPNLSSEDKKIIDSHNWNNFPTDALFIKRLSASDELVKAEKTSQVNISTYLHDKLVGHSGSFINSLTVQQAGVALERAGKVIDCLEFYEMVFKLKSWPTDEAGQRFAKERWLVCKDRQIDITKNDNRKRNIQGEINARRREWGMDLAGLAKFPDIDLDATPKATRYHPVSRVYSPDKLEEKGGQIINKPIEEILKEGNKSSIMSPNHYSKELMKTFPGKMPLNTTIIKKHMRLEIYVISAS